MGIHYFPPVFAKCKLLCFISLNKPKVLFHVELGRNAIPPFRLKLRSPRQSEPVACIGFTERFLAWEFLMADKTANKRIAGSLGRREKVPGP